MGQDKTKSKATDTDQLFTIEEVLERLKISRTTLWKLTKERGVGTLKIGGSVRYTQSGVSKLIEAN